MSDDRREIQRFLVSLGKGISGGELLRVDESAPSWCGMMTPGRPTAGARMPPVSSSSAPSVRAPSTVASAPGRDRILEQAKRMIREEEDEAFAKAKAAAPRVAKPQAQAAEERMTIDLFLQDLEDPEFRKHARELCESERDADPKSTPKHARLWAECIWEDRAGGPDARLKHDTVEELAMFLYGAITGFTIRRRQ